MSAATSYRLSAVNVTLTRDEARDVVEAIGAHVVHIRTLAGTLEDEGRRENADRLRAIADRKEIVRNRIGNLL